MKKIVCAILCVSVCVSRADIDFTKIKGLYTVFKTKQYLSPLFGFAWWHAGNVEKLYRYGDDDHKTVQLVRELFYLNPGDGLTFGPTILPTKLGTYLTPEAIGIILDAFEPYVDQKKLTPSEEQQLEATLKDKLGSSIRFKQLLLVSQEKQRKLRQELQADIEKAHKQADQLKKEQIKLESDRITDQEVKELKQQVVQISSQKKTLLKKKPITDDIQKKIDEKEQQLIRAKKDFDEAQERFKTYQAQSKKAKQSLKRTVDDGRRLENKIKNAAIDSSALNSFVELLVRAFEESLPDNDQRYLPYTVHNILLAMLWKKVSAKDQFIVYLRQLKPSLFYDSSFLQDNAPANRTWLHEQYAKKEYQTIDGLLAEIHNAQSNEMKRAHIEKNFERLVVSWYSYELFTNLFPPQVLAGWTTYKQYEFADCASSSLRNAINNSIYKPQEGILDSTQLDRFQLNDRVKNFYRTYGAVERIQEKASRDAWAAVTSELPHSDIDYKTPPGNGVCEIAARSGIANMNAVLNALFNVATLDDFAAQFDSITVSKKQGNDKNFGIYTFIIDNNRSFNWYIEPLHFYVSIEPAYFSNNSTITTFMNTVPQLIEPYTDWQLWQQNNMLFALIMLYRDRIQLFDSLVNRLLALNVSIPLVGETVLFLFNNGIVSQKIAVIKRILNSHSLRNNRVMIDTLKRIVKDMVDDLELHYAQIIQILLESPVMEDSAYPFKSVLDSIIRDGFTKIKDKYPDLVEPIVSAILSHKREQYYGMLKKKVSFTVAHIKHIVSNGIVALYKPAHEYLTRIKHPLSDEDQEIIRIIYAKKLDQLYAPIEKKIPLDEIELLKSAG